jgi:hypothetical protein
MEEPALWKLKTAEVAKPWGLVHEQARRFTGIRVATGEFWLCSAQTGPGNYSNVVCDPPVGRSLAAILEEAAEAGEQALEQILGANAMAHLAAHPHRGKTEAWYIRAVEGRTGVAAGPATRADADRLQQIIAQEGLPADIPEWTDEVRRLFGLIEPLAGGEMFLAPAGALHTMFAIGPDSRLIIDEIQQGYGDARLPTLTKILMVQDNLLSVQVHPDDETVAAAATGRLEIEQDLQANPTVRVYDFGRRPGEYPELGFELVDPEAGLRRVQSVGVEPEEGRTVEVMVATPYFAKCRHTLAEPGDYALEPAHSSYHTLHCRTGAALLGAGTSVMRIEEGETVFVPACCESELRVEPEGECVLFDDTLPDIPALTGFLGRNGAHADAIEVLLSPPRAIEPDH